MKHFHFSIIIMLSILVHFKGFAQEFDADINQAIKLSNEGKYQDAAELFERWAPIAKEKLGKNDTTVYLRLVSWAGNWYYKAGQYKQAETLIKEEVRIMKEALGKNHFDFGTSLNHLAALYLAMGNFDQAETLTNEALRIVKESVGESHPAYATNLNNLAQLYQAMGRYDQAETLMKEALRIDKESLGKNDPSYCRDINNLAILYIEIGRFEEAEPLMDEVIRISKKTIGEYHPDYSKFLNNLAQLYQKMGRFEKAEPIMNEVLRIDEKILGKYHPDYSRDINNLATLYRAMGLYEEAESYFKEALRITEETLGENHPQYVTILSNLAMLNEDMGSYEQTEKLIKKAMLITKVTLGENHPSYAIELNNLAMLFYEKLGRYDQAEMLMEQVMRIDRENLAKNHPSYGIHLHNLILTSEAMGYTKQLESLMKEAVSILKDNLRTNSNYLSETETEQLYETILFSLDIYQSFNYLQTLTGKQNVFAMDIELYRKGLLLNSVTETRKRILNSGDTTLINNYQTLIAYRKQADRLNSMPKEQQYENPAKLEEKSNELEKKLKLQSKEYAQSIEETEITWQQVQEKLKQGEAVVEFASFNYYNKHWTDSTLYCALVLKKGMEYPVMVPLFEQKQFDSLLAGGNAMPNSLYATRGVTAYYGDQLPNGHKLYNLIWKPLEKELKDVKTVYYSPSGTLHQVAFSALPIDTASYLCDKYNLAQLSSTRQLATLAWQNKPEQISSTALFGGIKYDLEGSEIAEVQRSFPKNDLALGRGFTSDSSFRSTSFSFLPGTMDEVNSIATTLQTQKIKADLYTGINGNEEAFKALSNQNISVLHIATHGFFYPDEKHEPQDLDRMVLMGEQKFRYVPNPLRRSGLILAGGNRIWKGEEPIAGMEDGILTAQEISEMNLQNTELVVLSACETGLGDIKGGEGVFGLQRAFKLAGVKTIIMSLWKVPDGSTSEMMQLFYSKWLGGMDKQEAFRETQREMRNRYPKSPKDWAGFVMLD